MTDYSYINELQDGEYIIEKNVQMLEHLGLDLGALEEPSETDMDAMEQVMHAYALGKKIMTFDYWKEADEMLKAANTNFKLGRRQMYFICRVLSNKLYIEGDKKREEDIIAFFNYIGEHISNWGLV